MIYWNIKGFQQYKLTTILQKAAMVDITILAETKETENNTMEDFSGFTIFTQHAFVDPSKSKSYSTASGGIKVLCRSDIGDSVAVWARDIYSICGSI